MSTFAPGRDDLRRWFSKGICAHTLRASDAMNADSLGHALKVVLVSLVLNAGIEFTIVSLSVKGAKFEELVGFPLFAMPSVVGWASFVAILLGCLWVTGSKVKPHVACALTLDVTAGMV